MPSSIPKASMPGWRGCCMRHGLAAVRQQHMPGQCIFPRCAILGRQGSSGASEGVACRDPSSSPHAVSATMRALSRSPRIAKCGDCRCSILRRHPGKCMLRSVQPKSPGMTVDLAAARLNNALSSTSNSMSKFDHHLERDRICLLRYDIPRDQVVTSQLSSAVKHSDPHYCLKPPLRALS
jgi:hypothetical protein